MDHRLGRIDLIRWQGRRNRRLKTGLSPWTLALMGCGFLGGLALAAQLAGLVPFTGVLAGVPAGLVVLAVAAPVVAVARAAIAWLIG
jgi:hypothetical protein